MPGRGGPLVVAHRGASEVEAEHTLAAYTRAIAEGADAVECDVRLTRDQVLVCVHDRRVDRTSDGRGVLSTLELADLQELDFASWRNTGESPDRDRGAVLTLDRLLRVLRRSRRRVTLAVETKHPTRYSGLVELVLVELLDRHGLLRPAADGWWPVQVMSSAVTGLRRLHTLAPGLPTVLVLRRMPLRYRDGTLPARVAAAAVSLRLLRRYPDYVARAHRRGGRVYAWTVNELTDVTFVRDLGVDAIITDRPAQVLTVLGRPPRQVGSPS